MINMSWGLWNKIKQGVKKAGRWIRDAARTVNDRVIQPFKPVISAAANAFNPTFGKAVSAGMNAVEKLSDDGFNPAAKAVSAANWAKSKWG